MSNIHPIHPQSKRHQAMLDEQRLVQACEWVARLDRELTSSEQAELAQWLQSSAANASSLLEVAQLWDKMDALQALADLFPSTQPVTPPSTRRWRPLALAASTVLVMVLSSWFWQPDWLQLSPDTAARGQVLAVQHSYQTRVGETSTIELPDQSKLVLNTNSFVTVRYTGKARIIELQRGEISIDVAHDRQRPLSVVAAGKVIQAVGTAFNVQVRNQQVELIVTDGKVLVETAAIGELPQADPMLARRLPASALAISKGERVDLDASGQAEEKVQKIDALELAASLSWRSGNLIFRGESLADAITEISRYTDVRFELADDAKLRDIHVAGLFKTGDVTGLLAVFKSNFNISHQKLDNDTILLTFEG